MKFEYDENLIVQYKNVEIGEGAIIEPLAILGIQDRFHPESKLVVGKNAFIGSRCTIYTGVTIGDNFDLSDQSSVFTNNIIGDRVRIGPKAVIKNDCVLGNDIRINSQVFLERVVMENNIFVGPHTVFSDDYHPPCPKAKECVPKTYVESFVSIGANVFLAPGIRIGHHTQIYGGAVVLKDVPPYSVVAGNPARVIKKFTELECHTKFYNKPFEWWDKKD